MSQSWQAIEAALSSGSGPRASRCERSAPATYSMSTQKKPPSSPPLVDRRHLRRHARELLLERDAVLLGLQHLRVGAVDAHHLERHLPLAPAGPRRDRRRRSRRGRGSREARSGPPAAWSASPSRSLGSRPYRRRSRRRRWRADGLGAVHPREGVPGEDLLGALRGGQQHAAAAVAQEAVLDQLGLRAGPHLDARMRGQARRPAVAGDQVGRSRGAAPASTSTPPPGLSWT